MSATTSLAQALAHARTLLGRAPALAAEQADAILEAVPNHPEAIFLRGAALRRQGDAATAEAVLATLAASQPRSAETRFELAQARLSLGNLPGAVDALRQTTALAPAHAEGWRVLGDALTLAGDEPAAQAAYTRQIRAAATDPTLIAAADALLGQRLNEAERLLKARLRERPTDVAAIRMLAELATRLGRNQDAENLLRRCLELAPEFRAARHNLAVVLYRRNRVPEAIPLLEELRAADPRDASLRALHAAALATIAEYDRAIEEYAGILKEFPKQPTLWMSYGHALRTTGRRAETIAAYRHALSLSPTLGEVWWSLANLKTEPFAAEDIAAMQSALGHAEISEDDRLHLHYALGRAFEDAGEWETSWTHYAEGARLRRAQVRYSADETSNQIGRIMAMFTPDFVAVRRGWGHPDPAPIFIVGLPRSGSTLLEQILASHSQVEGTMELQELSQLAKDVAARSDKPYPECLADLTAEDCAHLGAEYISRTRIYRKTDRPFFIDKMPNNWSLVLFLHMILPRATIIDARRHPMAAGFSNFKQHFARGQHFTYDLTELGRYIVDNHALMAHADTVLPGRILRAEYERTVADTEAQTRAVLAHCGLAFEPACLRFWETGRAVRTASSEQVRRPIFTEGIDQWRHYAPWLGALHTALGTSGK